MLWASRLRPGGAGLFPEAAPGTPGTAARPARRGYAAAVQVAAVAALAVIMLFRVAVVPAWNSIYAEDRGVFLVHALAHPWHLLVPYNGYFELLQRLLGQAIALLPLTWAAFAFAVAGALIAAISALVTYHASVGYIRSPALRAVLALSLILLPIAPLELADNGVNSPWYLMVALFWAVLWRPRTPAGKAVSAVIAFAVVASTPVPIVFAPLLAIRVYALRSVREHAVTIGWLLGWPLQAYAIAQSYGQPSQRVHALAPPGRTLAYYLHTVVLRAFGWHVSWALVRGLGTSWATLLCGVLLLALLGLAMTAGRRVRTFAILAVLSGFVFNIFTAAITNYVVYAAPYTRPVSFEAASRYSALPILLLYATLIVGLDAFASRHGGLREALRATVHGALPTALRGRPAAALRGPRSRPTAVIAAAAVLLCVLAAGWVTDYSYPTQRTANGPWRPGAVRWLDYCRHHEWIKLHEWAGQNNINFPVRVSCSRLVR